MQVYLNGEFLPAESAAVSVFDGGFLYGDGVYTTLRLYRGIPVDLDAHYQRLASHAAALELDLPATLTDFRALIPELASRNGLDRQDGRLRITLSRGGRPPLPDPDLDSPRPEPTLVVTLVPVDPAIDSWQQNGIPVVVLAPAFARAHFPELKTLNGLVTVQAQKQAARRGCPEALLTGSDGLLLEGSVSNLFLVAKGSVMTPAAEGGFLPGRTRERILGLAAKLGQVLEQKRLKPEDLFSAAEVFVASSVREILPVVRIDDRPVGTGKPGPLTRQFQKEYRLDIERYLA